ncbi:MAG: alkaline phosphatase family protein [Micrococcales bacterium]|nr:alkaline phosphatase family protein [Micrococcales bacterium]
MTGRRAWRADLRDTFAATITTALGLGVAVGVVDGWSGFGRWTVLGIVGAAVAVGVGDLVLQPLLRPFARAGGVLGALVVGLAAQVVVAFVALWVAGVPRNGGWETLVVLVVAGAVMASGRWLVGSHDRDYVVGDMVRRARRHASRTGPTAGPGGAQHGLLVVVLDGIARPVLDQAIDAGLAPHVQRWLDDGSHQLVSWWAQAPSSTPATQAGLLHGAAGHIPGFRWWDRDQGRLVVTNHPRDAAAVEQAVSDGAGLLAGGGTAVSLMFSGDAERSFMVMSQGGRTGPRSGFGPGAPYLRFFASPFLFARVVTLSVGEVVKEVYQAWRQRVNDVRPRIARGGWHPVLRAVTSVMARDLNTSLVADAMVRGDPVIMVDYVDYDVVAHFSGPTRPEALRCVEGLDGVLATLSTVAQVARRRYSIVVCSDHGQALGPTFEQVEGRGLLDVVRELMAAPGARGFASVTDEDWGPVNALLAGFRRPSRRLGRWQVPAEPPDDRLPEVVVGASGNLAGVWFPQHPRRMTLDELEEAWPGLVAGLAARPGVGAVVVDSARGLLAVGAGGVVALERGGHVDGDDPLAALGPRAAPDLARLGRLPHAGDLVVVSAVSARGGVHAFEDQVGSHGGLGGDQNEAFVVHPTGWNIDDDLCGDVGTQRWLVGSDALGAQLRRWAADLGLQDTGPTRDSQ